MAKRMIPTAYSAAKYLVYLASQDLIGDNKEREGITNLKLQKVLYFAQAYSLAKLGRPLFSGKIEAWEYGPVIPSVYRRYRSNGSNPIISEKDESSLDEDSKEILRKVWNTFGGYSAGRLVNITHAHAPWRDAYETSSKIISNKLLKDYYTPLLGK